MVGMAVHVRHHAYHFLALHLGAERAADSAVGAGRGDAVLGLTLLDEGFLGKGCRGASLHAGAAGNALRIHEGYVLARGHRGLETTILDGQREGALLLIAGAHAARADDALAGIEGKIWIARVLLDGEVIGSLVAVAHLAKAHHPRHVLQLAVSVGRTGQAVQGVIGDVELHHAAADIGELFVLGGDFHPRGDGGRAGGGQSLHALDLHQAQAAGAEGLELFRCAELRDLHVGQRRRAHHRGAGRHRDFLAIDGERHELGALALGRA